MKCAFRGILTRDAEIKTFAKTGREFLKLSVTEGEGERAQFVSVMGWRETFTELAPRLRKGIEVLVKGRLELRHWQSQEGPQHGLSCSADVIEIADVLLDEVRRTPKTPRKAGRAKADPQRPLEMDGADKPFDDALPF